MSRSGGPPAARPRRADSRAGSPLETAGAALVATLALAWRYRDAVRLPFLNDDYVFLDATAHRGFASLWGFDRLFFHWWRPWSREFHYWALQRLAGPSEPVFHLANLALAAVCLALFHDLARARLGLARATFATAAAAAMSSWALPLLWPAGAQDLWMIAWSLGALALWRRGRRALAFAAWALALASKETAAPLPLLFVAWDVLADGRTPREALLRALPAAAIALPWALAHPHLGGHWLRGVAVEAVPGTVRLAPPLALGRSVLALASADAAPRPDGGWGPALIAGIPAALLLGALALAGTALSKRPERAARGTVPFGLAWCACGWMALLLPGLGWHAYYGLFGALGAWLAIAALARPGAFSTLLVVLLALASSVRDAGHSADWGDAWYQRRAGEMLGEVRGMLLRLAPRPAPDTRMWFSSLPNNIGFLNADAPALRVWYRDSTLRGGFFSAWRPPVPGSPAPDRFFKLKLTPARRLVELHAGPEDAQAARAADAGWFDDHMSLAATFIDGGDLPRASREYEKIAGAFPEAAEPAYDVAVCRKAVGDTLGFRRWLEEAYRRPEISDRLVRVARASGLTHW